MYKFTQIFGLLIATICLLIATIFLASNGGCSKSISVEAAVANSSFDTSPSSQELNQSPADAETTSEPLTIDSDESKNQPSCKSDDNAPAFVMQELPQISSPFTKERVLKLNAIVQKSLDIINQFDKLRKAVDHSDPSAVDEFRGELDQFSTRAAAVCKEMQAAKVELVKSKEKYNKPIFTAMVKFVNDVDDELRKEIDGLATSD